MNGAPANPASNGTPAYAGGAGTATAGGVAGTNACGAYSYSPSGSFGCTTARRTLACLPAGNIGAGGNGGSQLLAGGGGGGGGWFGGGGGGAPDAGGGGGSSYASNLFNAAVGLDDTASPRVTISYPIARVTQVVADGGFESPGERAVGVCWVVRGRPRPWLPAHRYL